MFWFHTCWISFVKKIRFNLTTPPPKKKLKNHKNLQMRYRCREANSTGFLNVQDDWHAVKWSLLSLNEGLNTKRSQLRTMNTIFRETEVIRRVILWFLPYWDDLFRHSSCKVCTKTDKKKIFWGHRINSNISHGKAIYTEFRHVHVWVSLI